MTTEWEESYTSSLAVGSRLRTAARTARKSFWSFGSNLSREDRSWASGVGCLLSGFTVTASSWGAMIWPGIFNIQPEEMDTKVQARLRLLPGCFPYNNAWRLPMTSGGQRLTAALARSRSNGVQGRCRATNLPTFRTGD